MENKNLIFKIIKIRRKRSTPHFSAEFDRTPALVGRFLGCQKRRRILGLKAEVLAPFLSIILILAIVLCLTNLFDAVTTHFALKKGGMYEKTPSMAFLFEKFGFGGYIIKLVSLTYLTFPLKYCPMHYTLNKIMKSKFKSIQWISIALIIAAYLFLIYKFSAISISNLSYVT